MIRGRGHSRAVSGVVAGGWSFLVIGTSIYITAVVSYNCSGREENDTRPDKASEVCNAVSGFLPAVGTVLQAGPSVLTPLVAKTRADGERIAVVHMIPPVAVALLYATPILDGSGRALSIVMVMAFMGHLFLSQTKGDLSSISGVFGTNNAKARRPHRCNHHARHMASGAVDESKERSGTIYFDASEVASGEQEARHFMDRTREEIERMKAALERTEAEKYVLRQKLSHIIGQEAQQGNGRNSLYAGEQNLVDSQTGLLMDQGSLTLTLTNELQRTRSSLNQQKMDQEANQAEIKRLQAKIASLHRSIDGTSESVHTEHHHRTLEQPQRAKGVVDKSVGAMDASETSSKPGRSRLWADSVFFGPEYLTAVMDGSNVCLAPGMENVTANDGSPSDSGDSGPAGPSTITHPVASVSAASDNNSTPMSPPPSSKTLIRKAKRTKLKRKQRMAVMQRSPNRMPDGAPMVVSQQDLLLARTCADKNASS